MQPRIFIISIIFSVTLSLNSQNISIYESNEFQLSLLHTESTEQVYNELNHYFSKVLGNTIEVSTLKKNNQIHLSINTKTLNDTTFEIHSDSENIRISGGSEKALQRGTAFFLETIGITKITEKDLFFTQDKKLSFPSHFHKKSEPDFTYRYLYYPGNFNKKFRNWHQLDKKDQDFGIWGHSFHKLMPPGDYFEKQPELFALYNGKRNSSSVCYTNMRTQEIFKIELKKIIKQNPRAKFLSVSQNDDNIYCQCNECEKLNQKHGEERGAHYVFLNKLAKQLPQHNLISLAYLHTSKPPKDLHLAQNLYIMYCPIGLNRGISFAEDTRSSDMRTTLKSWMNITENLLFWDYTVQFTNYFSAFPNIHTFQKNYDYLKKAGVKGVFVQGSADIPSHFYELRQFLLVNLLRDTEINLEEKINDFMKMYYGNAAKHVLEYFNLLTKNQIDSNSYLSIYDNPIKQIETFLSPENMSDYNQIILRAEAAVRKGTEMYSRISDLRSSLEYTYFEQSKYFGKDQHGMFVRKSPDKEYEIRPNLTKRVEDFTNHLNEKGVYEISEMGLSPDEYLQRWKEIVNYANISPEAKKLRIKLLTQPSEAFKGKGAYGLVDGVRAYKDYNINWLGWYGNDAKIQIELEGQEVNYMRLNFLENQRHWIFPPLNIILFGIKDGQKIKMKTFHFPELSKNENVKIIHKTIDMPNINNFNSLILVIENRNLPLWRKRKNKKAMFMLDEIEIY